ncbi:RHS repeat domain-containing protein [Paenibacillus tyrfis]|uniref:Uncharacterized protein n=1 Tax=Paenibacillus tyrfis TaxID=1501230 RepID=A0A081P427_9BACL|nr:RHS repeat domain-containing protein [Paenibacillus tyrfis]KEQ25450.1 hypothetical protein ET33_01635 [Paenibacillus tyrfis]
MLKRFISFSICFMFSISWVSTTMAANVKTQHLYDSKGTLKEATTSNGTIYYDYDSNGNLLLTVGQIWKAKEFWQATRMKTGM